MAHTQILVEAGAKNNNFGTVLQTDLTGVLFRLWRRLYVDFDKLQLNSFVINLSSLSIYRQVTKDADDDGDDDYDRDSSLLPSLHCTAMLYRH